jgi:hypothetical protein
MTIRQAFEKMEANGGLYTAYGINPMFDIVFTHECGLIDKLDITEFTCQSGLSREDTIDELNELFMGFCKENKCKEDSVEAIVFMGPDPFYEGVNC